MKKKIWNIRSIFKRSNDALNLLADAERHGLIDQEQYEEALNEGHTSGWMFDDWKHAAGLFGKEVPVSPKSVAEAVGENIFVEKK